MSDPGARRGVNLALQGGGAYGAFTWGVLDELLAGDVVEVEGVSGASAGAVNAVLLADGLAEVMLDPKRAKEEPEKRRRAARDNARARLAGFWRAVSRDGSLPPLQRAVLDRLFSPGPFADDTTSAFANPMAAPFAFWAAWAKVLGQFYSPYDLNPFDINPLRDIIHDHVDFKRLNRFEAMQVYVSATNVRTGKLAVFTRDKLTCEAVMASTALPTLFRAVRVGTEDYWDGGYMGNPPIFPLYRTTETEDVLIVQLNPLARRDVPTSANAILNRMNEVTFNSPLQGELRAIKFTAGLVEKGALKRGREEGSYKAIRAHRIAMDGDAIGAPPGSKLNTDFAFMTLLRDAGVAAARAFMAGDGKLIGVRGSLDLDAETAAEWPA